MYWGGRRASKRYRRNSRRGRRYSRRGRRSSRRCRRSSRRSRRFSRRFTRFSKKLSRRVKTYKRIYNKYKKKCPKYVKNWKKIRACRARKVYYKRYIRAVRNSFSLLGLARHSTRSFRRAKAYKRVYKYYKKKCPKYVKNWKKIRACRARKVNHKRYMRAVRRSVSQRRSSRKGKRSSRKGKRSSKRAKAYKRVYKYYKKKCPRYVRNWKNITMCIRRKKYWKLYKRARKSSSRKFSRRPSSKRARAKRAKAYKRVYKYYKKKCPRYVRNWKNITMCIRRKKYWKLYKKARRS